MQVKKMQKNNRFLTLLLSAITFVLVGMFSACAPQNDALENGKQWIKSSQKTAQTVEWNLEMKDGDTVVYACAKTITFTEENSATVKTTESKLNSSFALETEENTDIVENATKESMFTLSLAKNAVQSYEYADHCLSVVVAKDKVGDVFGWENAEVKDAVEIVFVFDNQKLVSVSATFQTASGKNAVYNATYAY